MNSSDANNRCATMTGFHFQKQTFLVEWVCLDEKAIITDLFFFFLFLMSIRQASNSIQLTWVFIVLVPYVLPETRRVKKFLTKITSSSGSFMSHLFYESSIIIRHLSFSACQSSVALELEKSTNVTLLHKITHIYMNLCPSPMSK